VLTGSLHSSDAHRARAAGVVTLLPHSADTEVLLGEVDTLIPDAPRVQRMLKRRLLDLQELARFYRSDMDGQLRLRRLIDHLQIAILAVDASGHCIAASEGATKLTGYSRLQLQMPAVFQSAFGRGYEVREESADARTTTITTRTGQDVVVYAAAVAEILPGFHVAAFVAA
jgi:PAS domain-containing protein